MNPRPRKLALLMSIAGLGSSLSEGVQARSHAAVYTRPMSVEEWPFAVDNLAGSAAPIEGLQTSALGGGPPSGGPDTGGEPLEIWAATMLAQRMVEVADLPPATVGPAVFTLADDMAPPLLGSGPSAPAPASRPAVDSRRVRGPQGPRLSERSRESVTMADGPPDPPDAHHAAGNERGAEAARPADARVKTSRPARVVAAFAALAPADNKPASTAIDVEARANRDFAASFDIDLGYGPAVARPGNHVQTSHVDIEIEMAARADIELDILPVVTPPASQAVATRSSGTAGTTKYVRPPPDVPAAEPPAGIQSEPPLVLTLRESVGSKPTVDIELELKLSGTEGDFRIDLSASPFAIVDLSAQPPAVPAAAVAPREPEAGATPTGQSAVAPKAAPVRVRQPDATEPAVAVASDASATGKAKPGGAVGASKPVIIVGTHTDRVLHSLEALAGHRAPESLPVFGAQTDEIFVATQEDKVLQMLASIVEKPGKAPRPTVRPRSAAAAAVPAGADSRIETTVAPEQAPSAMAQSDHVSEAVSSSVAASEAASRPAAARALMDDQVALDVNRLEHIRGGFQPAGGVMMSFGIERAVYINGSLVTTTNLQVAQNGMAAGAAPSVTAGVGNLNLIQNGAGNSFIAGLVSPASLGTVVQNTLNDQKIEHITSINATVNSLQVTRANNFESALRGALVDSLRR